MAGKGITTLPETERPQNSKPKMGTDPMLSLGQLGSEEMWGGVMPFVYILWLSTFLHLSPLPSLTDRSMT